MKADKTRMPIVIQLGRNCEEIRQNDDKEEELDNRERRNRIKKRNEKFKERQRKMQKQRERNEWEGIQMDSEEERECV